MKLTKEQKKLEQRRIERLLAASKISKQLARLLLMNLNN